MFLTILIQKMQMHPSEHFVRRCHLHKYYNGLGDPQWNSWLEETG